MSWNHTREATQIEYANETLRRLSADHEKIVASMVKEYREHADSLMRKQDLVYWHQSLLRSNADTIARYAAKFNVAAPELDVDGDWEKAAARQLRLKEHANDPKVAARRDRERQRREAKSRAEYRAISGKRFGEYCSARHPPDYITDDDKAERSANMAALQAARKLTGDWSLAPWFDSETVEMRAAAAGNAELCAHSASRTEWP